MRAEQLERQIQGAEQERDQWEHKYEEAQERYQASKRELDEVVQQMESLSMLNGMLERIPGQFFSFGSLVKLFVSTLFLSRVARASVELFVTEHESIMQVVIFLLSHSTQLDLALEVLAQSVGLCA